MLNIYLIFQWGKLSLSTFLVGEIRSTFFGGKEWSRKIQIMNGAMEPVKYSLQIFFR